MKDEDNSINKNINASFMIIGVIAVSPLFIATATSAVIKIKNNELIPIIEMRLALRFFKYNLPVIYDDSAKITYPEYG